jgi:hypothetical protein
MLVPNSRRVIRKLKLERKKYIMNIIFADYSKKMLTPNGELRR